MSDNGVQCSSTRAQRQHQHSISTATHSTQPAQQTTSTAQYQPIYLDLLVLNEHAVNAILECHECIVVPLLHQLSPVAGGVVEDDDLRLLRERDSEGETERERQRERETERRRDRKRERVSIIYSAIYQPHMHHSHHSHAPHTAVSPSSFLTLSALRIVERRWAMTIVVREEFSWSLSIAACT